MLHADSRHCPPLPPPPPPQIQADLRLIQSKMFASGYSLRFPRIRRIREDKSCREVMTLQELTDMVEENKGNLTGAPAPPDSPFAPPLFSPRRHGLAHTAGGCALPWHSLRTIPISTAPKRSVGGKSAAASIERQIVVWLIWPVVTPYTALGGCRKAKVGYVYVAYS